jgi:hypothetical protein
MNKLKIKKIKNIMLSEQLKTYRKHVETEKKLIFLTHIYDRSLIWLSSGTSMKSSGVEPKRVLSENGCGHANDASSI